MCEIRAPEKLEFVCGKMVQQQQEQEVLTIDDDDDETAKMVRLGRFGDILPLMRRARQDRAHRDLILLCQGGGQDHPWQEVRCHRFVLGALSSFLRRVMEGADCCQQECAVYLPQVSYEDMQVAIQFLYSGSMVVRKDKVRVIKEILEDVLRIDANIALPQVEQSQEVEKRKDNDQDDSEGGGGYSQNSKRRKTSHDGSDRVNSRQANSSSSSNSTS